MSGLYSIGEAAARSGVSARMVRHYESLGLLPVPARTAGGYRQYAARDVHTLRFIRRARDLGFSMDEIAALLKLWQNRERTSAEVKRIALAHIADLDRRIPEMSAMKDALGRLAACCRMSGAGAVPASSHQATAVARRRGSSDTVAAQCQA